VKEASSGLMKNKTDQWWSSPLPTGGRKPWLGVTSTILNYSFFSPLHIPFALLLKHVVCFLLLLKDGLVYQRDRSNLWKIPEHSGENTPANHQEL